MKRSVLAGFGLLALFQCNAAISGESLSGKPLVLDGDTLSVRGKVVGLYGIAAPGPKQTCWNAKGANIPCGTQAATALAEHIGEAVVTCEARGADRHRRPVAVCRMGDEDLAAWMVSNGLAVADKVGAADYIAQDTMAWAKRRGLWAGVFEDPSERTRDDYTASMRLTALAK